jgi:Uncharacterised nucleotidyltransferase
MNPIFALLWGKQDVATQLAATLTDAEWQKIDFHGSQHRLRPLLHNRAQQGNWPVPAAILDAWQQAYRRSALRSLQQRVELVRICAALKADGIAVLVLKGGAFLGQQGFDTALRPMRDLDLLIPMQHLLKAHALLCDMGYRAVSDHISPSAKHMPALIGNGVAVELHRHIFDTQDSHAAIRETNFIARCWNRAVPATISAPAAFCPSDALLHLIWHAVLDSQFNNGPLLLTDIQNLTSCSAFDWTLFWHEAQQLKMVRSCQLALRFNERVSGLAVDWAAHEPDDLPNNYVEHVGNLMLVDIDQRTALGWPGQLSRLPMHRWPKTIWQKLKQRKTQNEGNSPVIGGGRNIDNISILLNSKGREHIAQSITLGRWLSAKGES